AVRKLCFRKSRFRYSHVSQEGRSFFRSNQIQRPERNFAICFRRTSSKQCSVFMLRASLTIPMLCKRSRKSLAGPPADSRIGRAATLTSFNTRVLRKKSDEVDVF